MTSRAHSGQQARHGVGGSETARAEADYQRLRQAYLELARGENNDVALAMVGADMERANALLCSLSGRREHSSTEPSQAVKRQARRLAEENA